MTSTDDAKEEAHLLDLSEALSEASNLRYQIAAALSAINSLHNAPRMTFGERKARCREIAALLTAPTKDHPED